MSAEDKYQAWLRSAHGAGQTRRTAERNAAFLLPHLKPGMRVLDVGCGGGSITIGLARAVAPAETVGLDRNASSVEQARELASAQDVSSVRFETGDAAKLPFDAASFDAVFAHALLQHVEDPQQVANELRRVLRPGGVLAVADADFDGSLIAPEDELRTRANDIVRKTRRHPQIGRQLRALLHAAGCERVQASVSAVARGDTLSVKLEGEFYARYFAAEPFIEYAVARGWSTAHEMASMAAAWQAWSSDPRAFSAAFWCQAVGWAPK
jgi:ubiquinone/menaquinone biosynthesis C-methylase UbiE